MLQHLIDWYARNGYAIERVEKLPDRSVTHLVKQLAGSNGARVR